ncbi:MAG: zinc ABC transporter substrate-binding protein [Candidatus Rhabdochlamydia sp.]
MKTFLLSLLALFCVVLSSCSREIKPSQSSILVTIPVYAAVVETLTDHLIDVQVLVPPGSDPHTYEPKPDQIRHFTEAKVWFRIGESIEAKMVSFLEGYGVDIINLSEGKKMLCEEAHHHHGHHHHHEEKDLHLWMDPTLLAEQVGDIRDHLIPHFPHMKRQIEQNAASMIEKLSQLDRELAAKLLPFKGYSLMVSHPAFGYFCNRYHLHQISIEIEGKDPLPQDIAMLMQVDHAKLIPFIIIEPQYSSKGATLIGEKLSLTCEEIDPYSPYYFSMLERLSDLIQEKL